MNDKSKTIRNVLKTIAAAAATVNAKLVDLSREPNGVRIVDKLNPKVEIEARAYIQFDTVPAVTFDSDRNPITNISKANLAKHILKRLAKRGQDLQDMALEDDKDAASSAAEDSMAKTLTATFRAFKPGTSDIDSPMWRNDRGWFKLAYIHVTGTVNSFVMEYNIEFDFVVNPSTADIHIKGEFDAKTSDEIIRTIRGILALN